MELHGRGTHIRRYYMNYISCNAIPYLTITARGLQVKSLEQTLLVQLQELVALYETHVLHG
jgi:hypothetical protein